ncbi:hypothetical protein Pr1d_33610 [Bythopirellula goksoeyrii]|uniref:Uncharacterized protein n=1 Tax=Bythopirellula goksoeyrii TaxID=1400387 RepID=A0A5B9QEX0_9BACT|nr:hypothetical protein Pr1d_33610 [Bythopirellula goksoeyrii]
MYLGILPQMCLSILEGRVFALFSGDVMLVESCFWQIQPLKPRVAARVF